MTAAMQRTISIALATARTSCWDLATSGRTGSGRYSAKPAGRPRSPAAIDTQQSLPVVPGSPARQMFQQISPVVPEAPQRQIFSRTRRSSQKPPQRQLFNRASQKLPRSPSACPSSESWLTWACLMGSSARWRFDRENGCASRAAAGAMASAAAGALASPFCPLAQVLGQLRVRRLSGRGRQRPGQDVRVGSSPVLQRVGYQYMNAHLVWISALAASSSSFMAASPCFADRFTISIP